ncbi:MAG: hypothetical protein COB46_01725 [Rhodospirillaceae bacterium]|nr:MAG: hypothetical protein COB46_01725 [Rhodospirillaceae bacterium]
MPNDNMNPNPPTKAPKWMPSKFWDEEMGEPRTEDLARSYRELERYARSPMSDDHPASASDYKLDVNDLLEVDEDVNQRLFDSGFSNIQAQLVYDLAHERLLPMFEQYSKQLSDEKQTTSLIEHFGSEERFKAIQPQIRAWGQANLGEDVFETLSGTAKGVIAIHEMMQNREPGLSRESQNDTGANETELRSMMNDPRYWRDRDPSFVARVRDGFKALYPEGIA